MKAEEYLAFYCSHDKDPLSLLVLSPEDKEYQKSQYSGSTLQTVKNFDGKHQLYSKWDHGKRIGRAFVRDEFGEDLVSFGFKSGLLDGNAVFRESERVYSIEFQEGCPTGNVLYTVISNGTKWKCHYECSNRIRDVECCNGKEQKYHFPTMMCMKSVCEKKKLLSFLIEPIESASTYKKEEYNRCHARRTWLKALSVVRELQQRKDKENVCLNDMDTFLSKYEEYTEIFESLSERVDKVTSQWNQMKKMKENENKAIKKRSEVKKMKDEDARKKKEKKRMVEEALKEAKCSQQRERQGTQPATIQQVAPQPVSKPAARQPPVLPSVAPQPVSQPAARQPPVLPSVAPQPVSQPAARQPPVLPSVTSQPAASQPLTTRQISNTAPKRGNLKKELDKEKVRVDKNDPDVFNLRRKLYVC